MVCAQDKWGASTCVFQDVLVKAPPLSVSSTTIVAESISTINITQLAGSGDVSSMQDAAWQLVAAYAASTAVATESADKPTDMTGLVEVAQSLLAAMTDGVDTQDVDEVRYQNHNSNLALSAYVHLKLHSYTRLKSSAQQTSGWCLYFCRFVKLFST
jgi:hypothetical protein